MFFLFIFTIDCIKIYLGSHTIKHFHVVAQIDTKLNIMEVCFNSQTLQIC